MADSVSHEREPALHEVDAPGGRGEADQDRGDEGTLHERRLEEVWHLEQPRLVVGVGVRMHVIVVRMGMVTNRGRRRPVMDDPSVA